MRIRDWSSDVCSSDLPWKVPDMGSYEPFPVTFLEEAQEGGFKPYGRDQKLARPWVKPGTAGLLHRIGGIEKAVGTGHIDYSPANHQAMTELRRDKVLGIANDIPEQDVCLGNPRSEEHTSELTSLKRRTNAVF